MLRSSAVAVKLIFIVMVPWNGHRRLKVTPDSLQCGCSRSASSIQCDAFFITDLVISKPQEGSL